MLKLSEITNNTFVCFLINTSDPTVLRWKKITIINHKKFCSFSYSFIEDQRKKGCLFLYHVVDFKAVSSMIKEIQFRIVRSKRPMRFCWNFDLTSVSPLKCHALTEVQPAWSQRGGCGYVWSHAGNPLGGQEEPGRRRPGGLSGRAWRLPEQQLQIHVPEAARRQKWCAGPQQCSFALVLSVSIFTSLIFPVLAEKIEDLGETVRSHFHIEEFASVSLPAQVRSRHCCGSHTVLDSLDSEYKSQRIPYVHVPLFDSTWIHSFQQQTESVISWLLLSFSVGIVLVYYIA